MSIGDFLEEVRRVLRLKHLSYHTEQTYFSTIQRYIVSMASAIPKICSPHP